MSDVFEVSNRDTSLSIMQKVNLALEKRGLAFTIGVSSERPGFFYGINDWVLMEFEEEEEDDGGEISEEENRDGGRTEEAA